MSKLTRKYQVSIPKTLADKLGIRPGDDLTWEEAGDSLRVRLGSARPARFSIEARLKLFDAASARQQQRGRAGTRLPGKGRGWSRADLYDR